MKRHPEPWMKPLSQSPSMVSILQRCVLLFVFITVTSHSLADAEIPSPSPSDRVVLAESAEAAYRRGLELVGVCHDLGLADVRELLY